MFQENKFSVGIQEGMVLEEDLFLCQRKDPELLLSESLFSTCTLFKSLLSLRTVV